MTNRALLLTSALVLAAAAGCNAPAGKQTSHAAPEAHTAPPAASSSAAASAVAQPSEVRPASARAALTRVENSAVCMVNNTYMGRPQIPVAVEGRTYYGCCEMCKGKLERDPASRFATDPVSGRSVDKATAVIARDDSNGVLYFENESTYNKYAGS